MTSLEVEGEGAYDDDFEEEDASDDDREAPAADPPALPVSARTDKPPRPSTPQASPAEARLPIRREPSLGRSGSRGSPVKADHRHSVSMPADKDPRVSRTGSGALIVADGLPVLTSLDDQLDNGRSMGSAPSTGRRVVRGKVSVGDDHRPGTGDSSTQGVISPAAPPKDSKPLWLQHDGKSARNKDALPSSGSVDPDPPRGARRARPGESPGAASEGDAVRSEDPRKIKRLQQEVQRLSQRLQESEMFSAHDDGLPKFALEEVAVGNMIAQGGFSSVHHATWMCTPCALKKIFDPVLTEELKAEFENEVQMLRRLRHPNVVTLMAVCRTPPALSILTEMVFGGSLFEILHGTVPRPRGSLEADPATLLPVVRQAGVALTYLHAMMVVHRDIKSQNVLLTEGNRPIAKLCDFGLARMRSELCTGSMQWAGTAPYMAPELFAKRKYDETVDVFAFGTMVWEVAAAEIPHANLDAPDIAHRVQTKEFAGLSVPHSWPKSLKNLLRSALSAQPDQRPAMTHIVTELETVIREFAIS